MSNILLTGASGFLGNTLINDFQKNFGNITAISRSFINYNNINVKNYTLDICDPLLNEIIERSQPTAIIHAAAKSTVKECELNPFETYKSNVLGTINILESVRKSCKDIPVIVFETDKVYGDQPKECEPTNETHSLLGNGAYGYSKVMMANACDFYRNYYGLKIYSLRSTNFFGYWDKNLSRIIPNTFYKLMNNQSPIVHEGSENQIRQYVYIDDVIMIIKQLLEIQPEVGAYNISGNYTRNPHQLIDEIKSVTGINKPTIIKEKDINFKEIQTQLINGTKLKEVINIEYTPIEIALEKMWNRFNKR